jgi:hypothetical protein
MRSLLLLSLALLLAACGGGPAVPDWKRDRISLIEKYKRAELKGENKLADRYFEQALDAAGSTGKLDESARLHLIRCATRQASLAFEACTAYQEYAKLSFNAENDAYYRFLSGQWDTLDAGKLPAHYREFQANHDAAKTLGILQKIDDPLPRLIAISLVVMRRQADDATLNLAAETASEQGWRKPLLVYLKLLENRASLSEDRAALEELRTRIKLVEESF